MTPDYVEKAKKEKTMSTYQFKPLEIRTALSLRYEDNVADGRDLVQESIDIVHGQGNRFPSDKHLLALLLLLKSTGVLA